MSEGAEGTGETGATGETGDAGESPDAASVTRQDRIEFVRVRVGTEPCALELGRVERVVTDAEITRVPRSSPAIVGVTAVASDIAPVVSGRVLLGLASGAAEGTPTLLVLDRGGDARAACLLVDEVVGIETHHVDRVAPADGGADWRPDVDRRWCRAVVSPEGDDRPVCVLDLRAVMEAAAERSYTP